ncbi:MAG TPA: SDR family oxidoreductase [Acidimicrobiales bacterium]|nr:SDR family oxidoreductase [Acidimicrobiales bacterium]
MELRDKVALVTGGAHGIGRALCERFIAEGARGVAVVDLDAKASLELARSLGDRAIGLAANVARERDVQSAVAVTEERFGPIDLMVSNAGIGTMQGIEAPDEAWQSIWDVNVMAHVYAARAVIPAMVARGGGYLLNTASAAGLLTQIGDAPYSVTKHAAVAFAEWLAITYGGDGIKVSCLCPQGVNTDMVRSSASSTAGGVVMAQGLIEPEDVAEAVIRGLAAEEVLILPHPEVRDYLQRKASDPDRWIAGMQRLQARIRDAQA